MLFHKFIKRVPFDKIAPFNSEDLLLIMSPKTAIVLKSIMNDFNERFLIKDIIINNKKVFGEKDFNERCKDFANIMSSRIERYFESNKSKYIFFDEEEQLFLKDLFHKNSLSCIVEVYFKIDDSFQKVDVEKININDFRLVRRDLSKLGVIEAMKVERYHNLISRKSGRVNRKKGFFNFNDFISNSEKSKIETLKLMYPSLSEVSSKEDFKVCYKKLAKKFHPDLNPGKEEKFKRMKDNFEYLKKTKWHKNLK